jgi:hypothetical protein
LTADDQLRDFAQLVAEGHTHKQECEHAEYQRQNRGDPPRSIARKLGLTSMAALVRYAVRNRSPILEP